MVVVNMQNLNREHMELIDSEAEAIVERYKEVSANDWDTVRGATIMLCAYQLKKREGLFYDLVRELPVINA